MYLNDIYTVSANLAGVPAHQRPVRPFERRPADRHAARRQFLVRRPLLNLAHKYETAFPRSKRPSDFADSSIRSLRRSKCEFRARADQSAFAGTAACSAIGSGPRAVVLYPRRAAALRTDIPGRTRSRALAAGETGECSRSPPRPPSDCSAFARAMTVRTISPFSVFSSIALTNERSTFNRSIGKRCR